MKHWGTAEKDRRVLGLPKGHVKTNEAGLEQNTRLEVGESSREGITGCMNDSMACTGQSGLLAA